VFFLWEIAVHPDARGLGLGRQLLAGAERLAREAGCRRVECTIRPTNDASRLLFEGLGYENVSAGAGPAEMREGHLAVRDFYEPGEAYMVYAKRLTGRGRPQRAQALRYTRSSRSVQR
jgi:ribosomal protein S18 acetylase RimI-like enzyme